MIVLGCTWGWQGVDAKNILMISSCLNNCCGDGRCQGHTSKQSLISCLERASADWWVALHFITSNCCSLFWEVILRVRCRYLCNGYFLFYLCRDACWMFQRQLVLYWRKVPGTALERLGKSRPDCCHLGSFLCVCKFMWILPEWVGVENIWSWWYLVINVVFVFMD
jgi:hypothetical protein